MIDKALLLVDDNESYRNGLLISLKSEGITVVGVPSGEDAIAAIDGHPFEFQFAVIDHQLKGKMDGIQTTRELVTRNQNLFVLVFTNVPSDNMEEIARYRYDALSAGAYRYLERRSGNEAPKQVRDFIDEIDQLVSLRDWIQDYYESRENVPSLLTQLDIGVDIIDRSYKVWYMNNAMRRIIGLQSQEMPKKPFAAWHEYSNRSFRRVAFRETFDDVIPSAARYLLPMAYRNSDKLHTINVWTQPIMNRQGRIILATDGKPLAVMESVQDMTDSDQLRRMPLDERLDLIAESIQSRPVDNDLLGRTYFEKVQIFLRGQVSNFVLKAAKGFDPPKQLNGPVDLYAEGLIQQAEDYMGRSGNGFFLPKAGRQDRVIIWPIIEHDRTIAVVRVSGEENCNRDSVPIIRSYADEVLAAIRDAGEPTITDLASDESEIAKLDAKFQLVSSSLGALAELVTAACKLTTSHLAVLRYREKDEAVLVRLGLENFSAYEQIASTSLPLSHTASWSVQAIISGQEIVANVISNGIEINQRRRELSDEAKAILSDAKALCVEPLVLDGRCIGALTLHSRDPQCYSDGKKLRIVRDISRRIVLALHDYIVAESVEKRIKDTQYETIGLLLHNINSPLGTIRYITSILDSHIQKKYPSDTDAMKQLSDLVGQIDRISRIRDGFLKLQKDWQSALEETDMHELLQREVDELIKNHSDIVVKFDLEEGLKYVIVDSAAIRECIDVILQNSLDEFENMTGSKRLQIRLRQGTTAEVSHITRMSPGLAIDIENNGSSVPSEIVKDLFSVIRSRKAKGLGFGLAYSRKVARLAHGDIYYHDEIKNVARFTLVLPYEQVKGAVAK